MGVRLGARVAVRVGLALLATVAPGAADDGVRTAGAFTAGGLSVGVAAGDKGGMPQPTSPIVRTMRSKDKRGISLFLASMARRIYRACSLRETRGLNRRLDLHYCFYEWDVKDISFAFP